ncbi:MAG: thermitase, partial [Fimbriimonadaceae bacterium]|nr:thermitase [Fimbriimonadaceae bacterium]
MTLRSIFCTLAAASCALSFAQVTTPKYVSDRLIVRFQPGTSATTIQSVNAAIGATVSRYMPSIDVYVVKLRPETTVTAAKSYYTRTTSVKYASESFYSKVDFIPNDPDVANGRVYGLSRINAYAAWDLTQGRPDIKIAIIDTGIDMTHPDLKTKNVDPHDVMDGDHNPTPSPATNIHGIH